MLNLIPQQLIYRRLFSRLGIYSLNYNRASERRAGSAAGQGAAGQCPRHHAIRALRHLPGYNILKALFIQLAVGKRRDEGGYGAVEVRSFHVSSPKEVGAIKS